MRIFAGPDRTSPGAAGTPVVDLLLVGLVVVAVLQVGRWVVQHLAAGPERVAAASPAPAVPQQIVLTLRADGSCLINGAGVDPRGLGRRLAALYRDRRVKLLFVEAAPQLPFGEVRHAVEVAYRAGVQTVGWLPPLPRSARPGGGRT